MPEYLSPGVYVEEVPSGIRPIEGVGTSTGAFIGVAEKGPIGGAQYEDGPGRPVLITNFGDFTRTFGGFISNQFLAYAVQQFFGEGGTRCYITRAAHFGDTSEPETLTARRARAPLGGVQTTLGAALDAGDAGVTLASVEGIAPGMVLFIRDATHGLDLTVTAVDAAALTVTVDPPVPEGTPAFAVGSPVTQVVLNVNAINEGEWGNNLRVAVSVSGLVITTLAEPIAANATTARLTSVLGIEAGMSLFIAGGGNLVRVQVTRIVDAGAGRINFRNLGIAAIPDIPVDADVTGISLGRASTVLSTPAAAGDVEAVVESAEGITVGSVLLFVWPGGGAARTHRAMVNRVAGNRIFFDPPMVGNPPAGTIVSTEDFSLTVFDGSDVVETHPNLSIVAGNMTDFVETRINLGATRSRYIRAGVPSAGDLPPARTAGSLRLGSSPGTEGTGGDATDPLDFIGSEAAQTGFFAFDTVDDINILAAPAPRLPTVADERAVILAGLTYCENRKDVFYVAEIPRTALTVTEVLDFKNATGPFAGQQALNSRYGAIYWPWVRVLDPLTNRPIAMPPSGAVIGSYSATDVRRGVHKAPAGVEDGFLNTAIGIEKVVTKGEHDVLNPQGINVIRSFPGAGIVIWGARTVSRDPEWRYVNVRRLFLFLEESIDEGTQWAVFEPNDPVLWARIRQNVSAFLRIQWLDGKLVGTKEEDAFFVKCDEETNPPESVDLGRVITLVGVAPSKPAEFVIFRIMQKRPGAEA
jgi:phage tail sheath protein FI